MYENALKKKKMQFWVNAALITGQWIPMNIWYDMHGTGLSGSLFKLKCDTSLFVQLMSLSWFFFRSTKEPIYYYVIRSSRLEMRNRKIIRKKLVLSKVHARHVFLSFICELSLFVSYFLQYELSTLDLH